eukprot:1152284-Pelagomonas_calceolata.AAC.3
MNKQASAWGYKEGGINREAFGETLACQGNFGTGLFFLFFQGRLPSAGRHRRHSVSRGRDVCTGAGDHENGGVAAGWEAGRDTVGCL